MLAVAVSLASFCWSAVVVQLVPLLLDAGRGIGFATLAAGLAGIAQLPGRLAYAALGDTLFGGRVVVASSLVAVTALAILAVNRSDVSVLASVSLFGVSAGLMTLVTAGAPAELFGRGGYGTISGAVYACANLARAAAPFTSAGIVLLPGGYSTLLWALAAMSAASGLLGAAAFREGADPPVRHQPGH